MHAALAEPNLSRRALLLESVAGVLLLGGAWLGGASLGGGLGCAAEPRWERVSAADASFSVEVPSPVRESVQPMDSAYGKLDAHFTTAVFRGTTYALMWVDYPVEALTSTQEVLDHAVSGALYSFGASIEGQQDIEVNGFAGREIRAKTATSLPMRLRIYLVGRRLYQLSVSGLNRPASEGDASRYLESFALRSDLHFDVAPSGATSGNK